MVKRILKYVLVGIVSSNILLSSVTALAEPVSAVPVTDGQYDTSATMNMDEARQAVQNRLSNVTKLMNNSYDGQIGLLYDLRTLAMYTQWVDFINQGQFVTFSPSEKKNYNEQLKNFIEKFNRCYKDGKSSSGAEYSKLDITMVKDINISSNTGVGLSPAQANQILNQIIYDYIKQLYSDIYNETHTKIENDADEANDELLKKYDGQLKYAYYVLQSAGQTLRDIQGISNDWGKYVKDDYKGSIATLTSLLEDPYFKELVAYGRRKIAKAASQEIEFKVNNGNTLFERLTETYSINGGSKDVYVNKAYLAMFASSSVYRPFRSKVGDQDYTTALLNLARRNQDVVDLYNEAKGYRKPLYKRSLSKDNKEVSGSAERITLKEFMDNVENEGSGALVTIKGKFKKPEDSDSYAFVGNSTDSKTQTSETVKESSNSSNSSNSGNSSTSTGSDSNNSNTSNNTNSNGASGNSAKTDTSNGSTTNTGDSSKTTTDSSQTNNTGNQTNSNSTDSSAETGQSVSQSSENQSTYKETIIKEIAGTSSDITPSENTITDQSKMTDPLVVWDVNGWGNSNMSGKSALTLIILHNIIKDYPSAKSIPNADKRFLFIDPFGNVVLDDGTVILPAATNPMFIQSKVNYYPYTAGFLNAYPKLVDPTSISNQFKLSSEADKGKYMIVVDGVKTDDNGKINLGSTVSDFKAQKIQGDDKDGYSLSTTTDENIMKFSFKMYEDGGTGPELIRLQSLKFKGSYFSLNAIGAAMTSQDAMLILDPNRTVSSGSNAPLFPYEGLPNDDSSRNKDLQTNANYIASKFFDEMTRSDSGDFSLGDNGKYNNKLMTLYLSWGLDGNNNIASFVKNAMKDKQDLEDGNYNKFVKLFVDMDKAILKSFGFMDGMLGLKTAYQDPIFGKFFYFADKYVGVFLLVAVFIVLIRFMRRQLNMLSMIAYMGLSVIFVYGAVSAIPSYIPEAYNVTIEGMVRTLSQKALLMRQEQYTSPFPDAEDSKGKVAQKLNKTTSITLYKLTSDQVDEICLSNNIPRYKLMSGTSYMLDSNSGLFVEGNCIKMSANALLAGTSIYGRNEKSAQEGITKYTIFAKKRVSSVVDYYTPYNQIVDSFVKTLNTMTEVYNIPVKTLDYSDYIHKDSFMVDSFAHSAVFLTPNNLDNYFPGETDEERFRLKNKFKNPVDFLGLSDLLGPDISKYKDTLWYKTMKKRDLLTPEKEKAIIENVNKDVKTLVADLRNILPYTSDENLIKTISLYAAIEFNNEIGGLGDFVYPMNLNYEELSVSDVYLPILIDNYSLYVNTANLDLVTYIYDAHGLPGLILFMPVIILAFLVCIFYKFFMPLFYVLLLFLIILRLIMKETVNALFKGFSKSSGIILVAYMAFVGVTIGSSNFNKSFAVYVFLLACYLPIFYLILMTVICVVTSPMDFGSVKVNGMLTNIKDKIVNNSPLKYLKVQTASMFHDKWERHKQRSSENEALKNEISRYSGSNNDVDSVYDNNMRRHNNYYRDDDYDVRGGHYSDFIRGKQRRNESENNYNEHGRRKYKNVNNYRLDEDDEDDDRNNENNRRNSRGYSN